jgi:DNA-binding NtrC family response regulator
VDDEKSIRTTLTEFLNRDGFEAESACDAATAFQMMENSDYDVVVTDVIMPKMSGMNILEKIREMSENTQVIIMTGEPSVDTAILAVKSGASDYLRKPIKKTSCCRQSAKLRGLSR